MIRVRITAMLLFLTLGLSALAAQRDTLRILAIGNSFSQDAIEQNLWELFDAEGIPVIVGNLYIGGCTRKEAAHKACLNPWKPQP